MTITWLLGPEEEKQSPGNSVAKDSVGNGQESVPMKGLDGVIRKGGWDSSVILTHSRLNAVGAQLVIPNREGTLTLETGLGSKRKAALRSEKRPPVSCHGLAEDSEGS